MSRRRPEGVLDATKDFMLDRLDDALEPLARVLTGKSAWDEMKQNALAASDAGGAAVLVADQLKALAKKMPGLEIHMVGHSAGSILLAPVVKLLTDRGLTVETCTLWAPACTVDLFRSTYLPAMQKKDAAQAGRVRAERQGRARRQLRQDLQQVAAVPGLRRVREESRAFRSSARASPSWAWSAGSTPTCARPSRSLGAELVLAPNNAPADSQSASNAMHHGDFDDDEKTVESTFRRILAGAKAPAGAARGARARQ